MSSSGAAKAARPRRPRAVHAIEARLMIRRCADADVAQIDAIVNAAARAYRGVIPPECWHEPYMSRAELTAEIAAGVAFFGSERSGELVGVMGLQRVRDVTLIRHAYVLPAHQGC